jgi:hypothetical protein
MASAELSRRVGKVVGYPPLVEMSAEHRREFHGKWQAAMLEAEESRPNLRVVSGD